MNLGQVLGNKIETGRGVLRTMHRGLTASAQNKERRVKQEKDKGEGDESQ